MSQTAQSKRERLLAARAERQRIADEGRRKARQRRRLTLGAVVLLAVVALAGLGLLVAPNLNRPSPGRAVPDEGRTHVEPGSSLTYKSDPPASGPHYPNWARSGIYNEPLDKGNWVHSLEHGYVVMLYNCPTACPDLISQLKQFYESAPKSKYGYQKLIIMPYPGLQHLIAAVAWDRIDELDQFDADRLKTFYTTYLDHGPEDAQ